MDQYPSKLLERAVSEMSKLPGIGRKTALRLVLHLLRKDAKGTHALAESLLRLRDEVLFCKSCHNISDTEICEICSHPHRDHSVICVVENVQNVLAVESTGQFKGLYHVLGGVISPMDGVGPGDLQISSLVERVAGGTVKEVIFALNPTMEGDTTNFYISRKLSHLPSPETPVTMSVLARGVCVGDDLEYTDEVTLGRSIIDRVILKN
ncbi:recombination protein RecR [Alloprevotella sp. OH1205_COT-284]|nr:recombination protein RecR [Alloprevotella sp. OH1205_COT-284]